MWGTLKKDFGEFVTTVATDATDALQTLDQNLDADGNPIEQVGLIDPDTGMPMEYDAEAAAKEAAVFAGEGPSLPPPQPGDASPEEMKDFLVTCDGVFVEVLEVEEDPEAARFVESFDISTRTDQISALLETNQQLEQTFSRLNDQVEYADFWKRYFYRLDERRLEDTYEYYYLQHVEALRANDPKAKATAALSNVTNFLGGVVHRLVEENDANDTADDDEEIVEEGEEGAFTNSATSAAVNFLAGSVSGARPPFVMNMAMSDDDDGDAVADQEEEEEEEEELGWDDDDDDDISDDEEDEDENETVEFKDAEKEKLQEDLAQAQEERDMLHKTVEMQKEEITKLKEAKQPEVVAGGDESAMLRNLQMQLFEKDSELAALRSQLDDMKNDEGDDEKFEAVASATAAKMAAEVDRLKETIVSKDKEIADLKANEKTDEQYEAEAAENAAKFAREMDRLKEQIAAKDRELAELREADKADQSYEAEASAAAAEAARELDRLKEEAASKDNQLAKLQASNAKEMTDLRSQLEQAEADKAQIKSELQSQLDDLRRAQQEDAGSANAEVESTLAQKDTEIANLTKSLEQAQTAVQAQGSMQQELTTSQEELARAKADQSQALEIATAVRTNLAKSHATIEELQTELEQTKATLREREAELRVAKRPSSPGSNSTGVKVSTDTLSQDDPAPPPTPEPVVAKQDDGGDDEGDGWGDDW